MPDLVGAYVGTFRVGEEYVGDVRVPGCLPDATCGVPICGTGGVCGSWWACSNLAPRLLLTPGAALVRDVPSVGVRVNRPALTLQARAVAIRPDSAIPAKRPALILQARATRLGLDQTLPVNRAVLLLTGRTAWAHEPGLIAPDVPETIDLIPSLPEEGILIPTVPSSPSEEDWLLRPTSEESM